MFEKGYVSKNAVSLARWAKLIAQWSGDAGTPEVKLVANVLAQAITDERGRLSAEPKFCSGFFAAGAGFFIYCNAIGVNPVFLLEQVARAADYDAGAR